MQFSTPACSATDGAPCAPRSISGPHALVHRLSGGLTALIGTGSPRWPAESRSALHLCVWLRGHGALHDGSRTLRIARHDGLSWLPSTDPSPPQATPCALHVTLQVQHDALCALAGEEGAAFLREQVMPHGARVAPASAVLLRSAQALLDSMNHPSPSRLLRDARCMELLAHWLATRSDERPLRLNASQRAGVARARELLFADLSHPPSTSALARASGLNAFRLKQGFRAAYGQSLRAAYQAERMRVAWQLIASGEMDVSSAGHHIGYANLSHFSAAFLRHHGLRPSELKRCAAQAP